MPFILPLTSVSKGGDGNDDQAPIADGNADAVPATWASRGLGRFG